MNGLEVRVALTKLNRTQRELLFEVRKRGYPKLGQPAISGYINGTISGPQSESVMKIISDVLREWERSELRTG